MEIYTENKLQSFGPALVENSSETDSLCHYKQACLRFWVLTQS